MTDKPGDGFVLAAIALAAGALAFSSLAFIARLSALHHVLHLTVVRAVFAVLGWLLWLSVALASFTLVLT